jgi:hypothetical protein
MKEHFDLRATVMDPAPFEIGIARAFGLKTVIGFVEDHDPGGAICDFIVLCQTVDHLLDVSLLSKIRDPLSEDGLFFVDFRVTYRRSNPVEEAVEINHPNYPTDETMRAYLASSGFEVLEIDSAVYHLHVGYLCKLDAPDPDALADRRSLRISGARFTQSRARCPGTDWRFGRIRRISSVRKVSGTILRSFGSNSASTGRIAKRAES